MRLLFASTHSLDDRRVYSGITYHMYRALERAGAHMVPLDSLRTPGAWWMKPRKLAYRMAGREHERFREPRLVQALARQIEAGVRQHRADIALGTGVHMVGAVRGVPFTCWPDATFAAHSALYPQELPHSAAARRNGHALERHALAHATGVAFSSEWARASAVVDYGADPERVAAIHYGANLDAPPPRADVERRIDARQIGRGTPLELLFVGKDFERKGGPRAVEIAAALHRRGIPVVLRIVGPPPERLAAAAAPFVVAEGFLDAQTTAGSDRLAALYAQAHLFLLPTQADCTPMVLAEAMAHGVPCLTTRVGGISSQITPGTGLLVDPADDVTGWADALLGACASEEAYRSLARAARDRYEEALNWDAAASRFLAFLEARLRADGGRARPARPVSAS